MPFQRGYVYPLKDAHRFDDELGNGYAHTALANRGPIDPECWVHDAWIVNEAGLVHPGLNVSPVPIRLSDVNEVAGLLWTWNNIPRPTQPEITCS